MNISNVLLLATLLFPAVSFAVCPVEHSTVFYINGIGVRQPEADSSTFRLSQVLTADPRVRSDCVSVKSAYSYSADETIPHLGIALDLTEALIQKAAETGRSITDATRSLLRLDDAAWIDDVLEATAVLASGPTYLIDNQITEHLAGYELETGTRLLVGHSQGNYYANEEWNSLSAAVMQKTHLIAVATPATSVVDGGPHITLAQDNWAAGVFALFGAPLANVSNTEPCIGNFNDRWNCHGWKESYMNGVNSRELITDDIIASLPAAVGTPGAIIYQPSDSYSPYNEGTDLFIAPYCVWFGDSRFSACQVNGSMAFTPSSTTTLGSVQLGIMQQNANDTVTVKVCTTSNCAAGTVMDTSLQFLPVFPIASTSGTLDSISQPVFAFPNHATLTKNVTYYVVVFPVSTLVYICSPYNHFGVSNALFVVKS